MTDRWALTIGILICLERVTSLSFTSFSVRFVPLVGAPPWLPPMHSQIILVSMNTSTNSSESKLLDFLPKNAERRDTFLRLLSLRDSPGMIRFREVDFDADDARKRSLINMEIIPALGESEVSEFIASCFPANLHLLKNNCYSFTLDFLRFVMARDNEDDK